jgi:hypothetical protein
MRLVRSTVALVFGFVLAAVGDLMFVYLAWVRGSAGSGLLLMFAAVVWLGLAGLVIGTLTAFIAGWRSVAHATAVAVLTALVAIVSLVLRAGPEPTWYRFLEIFILAPAMTAGAIAYRDRLRRRVPTAT